MISHPGDNRTALIAALIAIPSAALITMAIHTFVPVQQNNSSIAATYASPAPEKGSRRPAGPRGEGSFNKEEFKKMFMERRQQQAASLKKIAELSQKKCQLLKKQKAAAQDILQAETDYLLAQAALLRHEAKIRSMTGTPAADLAVKAVSARKLAKITQAAFKAGRGSETAALKSEIAALQAELQLSSGRLNMNPQWKEALAAYQKQQNVTTLKALIEVERSAQPQRRGMR